MKYLICNGGYDKKGRNKAELELIKRCKAELQLETSLWKMYFWYFEHRLPLTILRVFFERVFKDIEMFVTFVWSISTNIRHIQVFIIVRCIAIPTVPVKYPKFPNTIALKHL